MGALTGLRVLDCTEFVAGPYCGRILADLGAEVIKVEPPGGDRARHQRMLNGRIPDPEASPLFVHLNTNKLGITADLDSASGRKKLATLAGTVDVLIEDRPAGSFASLGLGYEELSRANPRLVLTSITPFGQTGPFRDYRAEHLHLFNATEGHTSARTTDGRPTVGGGHVGDADAGLVAGLATLAAVYQARRTGKGQHVDISRFEVLCALQRVDVLIARNRDRAADYRQGARMGGLLPAKDGHVVMTVVEDHHWRYLAEVLGDPDWSKDPRFHNRETRSQLARQVQTDLVKWSSQHTKQELYEIGQGAKFPLGPVLTAPEILESPQLNARGYFVEIDHPAAGPHRQASMAFQLSKSPWQLRHPSPRLGEQDSVLAKESGRRPIEGISGTPGRELPQSERFREGLPLSGVRIVDFTWAWAGSYATYLLGCLGAEVIKIESLKRLDLSRNQSITTGQRFKGYDSSTVFHDINMNKKCVRLNLSKPEAIPLVQKLVGMADVVAQNMRPGVLERLGLGYEALAEVKPDIIMLSSSAVGSTGPHRSYVGYAPVFAALAGLAHVTGSPGGNPVPLYGAVDLRSATTSAFAVMAALHQRATTGEGQHIDLSSVESIASLIGHLATEYQLTGLVPGRRGNDDVEMAPHNAYPCLEGRWVTISVADDREWEALCRVAGPRGWAADARFGSQRERWRNRRALDRAVSQWTRGQAATKVTELLQAAGVAALPCFDEEDLARSPQLEARGVFSTVHHEVLGNRQVLAPPWRLTGTPAVPQQPAPLLGEHSRYVLCELLGLSEDEVSELEAAEVVY